MKKIILTAIGAALVVASTMQVSSAAERRHTRNAEGAPVAQQFRNAHNAVVWSEPASQYSSSYGGHGFSAPAGR
jgi:cysteine synthase